MLTPRMEEERGWPLEAGQGPGGNEALPGVPRKGWGPRDTSMSARPMAREPGVNEVHAVPTLGEITAASPSPRRNPTYFKVKSNKVKPKCRSSSAKSGVSSGRNILSSKPLLSSSSTFRIKNANITGLIITSSLKYLREHSE